MISLFSLIFMIIFQFTVIPFQKRILLVLIKETLTVF